MAAVLVVDDEVGIANLLSDVLSDEGHRVLVAVNGYEALKRAVEERPDLVITDFMMPLMDGAQLIKAMADHTQTSGTSRSS
jgi:CheY-like chemotaxis protein